MRNHQTAGRPYPIAGSAVGLQLFSSQFSPACYTSQRDYVAESINRTPWVTPADIRVSFGDPRAIHQHKAIPDAGLVRLSQPPRLKFDNANEHVDIFSRLRQREHNSLPLQEILGRYPNLASAQNRRAIRCLLPSISYFGAEHLGENFLDQFSRHPPMCQLAEMRPR